MEESKLTRVAIVVQRYGKDIVGGAESHARILAEKLAGDFGYRIEVYTTTAKDYQTWDNEYLPGIEYQNGIQVRRFHVAGQRMRWFGVADRVIRKIASITRKLAFLGIITEALEHLWIYWQGPVSPELIDALHRNKHRYKKIIFFCYLYHPTIAGLKGIEDRSILIPLAHDEPAFYFSIVRKMFARSKRMIPNTEPEWDMIKKQLTDTSAMIVTPAGIGFESSPRETAKIDGLPDHLAREGFILYLGRVSAGKGVADLIRWFTAWRTQAKSDIKLVLAGHLESSVTVPHSGGVEYIGYVTEAQRDFLMGRCKALVNPSAYESLSMIVIEALVAGKPVLARRQCAVFRFYADFAPSIALFGDEREFASAISEIDRLGDASKTEIAREWASKRFSWDSIMGTFKTQIEG